MADPLDRPEHPRELADWLLARGRHWVTTEQVSDLLETPRSHVSPTLARSREKGLLFSPTKGAYVPIPPEFRSWGAVPASHFIDPMMRHLGHDYYVALLSAAEVHGFAHQRPQVFQVMTPARLRDRSFGRVRLQFVASAEVPNRAVDVRNTRTGTMRVSTRETTVLDLVESPRHGGGISNVATILGEMISDDALDIDRLADLSHSYPIAVGQRTGWLLDLVVRELDRPFDLAPLLAAARHRPSPTPLLAHGTRRGPVDERWHVIVNGAVEPDL